MFNPLRKYCHNPKCNSEIYAEDLEAEELTCEKCGLQTCFKCIEKWHGHELTCEEAFIKRLGN
jgi:hypothetical protein